MDQMFEQFSTLDFSSETGPGGFTLSDAYQTATSGKQINIDVQLITWIKEHHHELTLTAVPTSNANLLQFAGAGYASAELDLEGGKTIRWRGYIPPPQRGGGAGYLADAIFFAKYHYKWNMEDFILYTATIGMTQMQYILKEPRGGEDPRGHSRITDALLTAVGSFQSIVPDAIYVFDQYWYKSVDLWNQVQKASWDKVILDEKKKEDLVRVASTFFDSKQVYEEYGVPWKRGLIFHGPPGNGKTISIKALMHTMYQRKQPCPCLYVKNAPYPFMIPEIFELARSEAPCVLVFEDVETIVTPNTRSLFLNEIDGIASNDGIMMIASTNYLDRLDPGLTKRPSRFDRKYFFPMPSKHERELYCQYWQAKCKDKPIEFPDKLCPAIADITDDFSFAYLQELFIASLLVVARGEEAEAEDSDDKAEDDPLDSYKLWRIIKRQAAILRENMDEGDDQAASAEQDPLPVTRPTRGRIPVQGGKDAPSMHVGKAGGHAAFMQRNRAMMQPSFSAARLTSEQALGTLTKVEYLGDQAFEWLPMPAPYI